MRRTRLASPAAGFTLFELLVVLAIFGILGMVSYPSIRNVLEIRSFETAARDVMSTLQMAKWQAVNTKLNHRVRFISASGRWSYLIEAESPSGTWTAKRNLPTKIIDFLYVVTVNLPANSSSRPDSSTDLKAPRIRSLCPRPSWRISDSRIAG
jgi:prepilin-type N-terminal cleavage/methylation domain-containing protein